MIERIRAYLAHVFAHLVLAATFLGDRLHEGTTWTGIVGAIASAKEFPSPLNYLGIVCGTIAILVPDRKHESPPAC